MTGKAAPCSKLSASGSGSACSAGTRDQLRLAAEAGAGDDPVADRVLGHTLPHRLDLAGDLVAEHAGRLGRVGVEARRAPSCRRS